MAGRIEYKYLVPNSLLDAIRSEIRPYLDRDRFAEKKASNEYTVRSVYYDTPKLDCYYEKSAGLQVRRKFRIRGYDRPREDSLVFLEIKKKNSAFIEKHRAPLRLKDLDSLFCSREIDKYIITFGGTEREKNDAARFLYHYYRQGLRPTVLVVYDREAFFGRFDTSLRLTFDKNLRGAIFPSLCMLYDEEPLEPAMSQHFILEVKFFRSTLPAWVLSMITRYELPRMALSKYSICLDSLQGRSRSAQMGRLPLSTVWGATLAGE